MEEPSIITARMDRAMKLLHGWITGTGNSVTTVRTLY